MSLRPSVCFFSLFVSVEQLDSHWMDFDEILYWSIFRNSVEQVKFLLKHDKNNMYFTWGRVYIYAHMSLNYS